QGDVLPGRHESPGGGPRRPGPGARADARGPRDGPGAGAATAAVGGLAMSGPVLRVHRFLPCSRANGPGARAVFGVKGCPLGCPGCDTPAPPPLAGGGGAPAAELFARLVALGGSVQGLTVSGGEPLQQRPALLALLRRVRRETNLSVLVFTGFTW